MVVAGGGPAGLSAAVALARSRRSVLLVDDASPRNATAGQVHNYLGREGTAPAELLAYGRDEVVGYGGEIVDQRISGVHREPDGGFVVHLDGGAPVRGRRLLVATGLRDDLPDIPGVAERWGRDVLHCPYCHGYEVRDQAVGVLAGGPMSLHQAQLFRQLTPDVTLILHQQPAPEPETAERLAARGITVVAGEVERLEVTADRLTAVRLRSGARVPLQALVVAPRFTARSDILGDLGLRAEDLRMGEQVVGSAVPADPTGATTVPGVWVAGNITDLGAQVIASAAAGLKAGAAINADLVEDDVRRARDAYRLELSEAS